MSSVVLKRIILVWLICNLVIVILAPPAHAQNNVIGIISKLIEEQRALKEQQRQEALAVKRMQSGLKALGYYDGAIDGNFGSGTRAGLTEYRQSMGRSPYGDLSIEEVQEIEVQASEVAARPTPPPQSSGVLVRAKIPQSTNASLSSAAAWIVIASRETPEEAVSVAEGYVQLFTSTTVIRSTNGRYAVVAGWLNKDFGRPLKDALIAGNLVPQDTFLSSGSKFKAPIWSTDGQLIDSRTDLLNYALIRPTATLLSELGNSSSVIAKFGSSVGEFPNASDYLSLRTADSPSSKETRRLPEGTLLKVAKEQNGWLQVRLLNGMTGWVLAKYVSKAGEGNSEEQSQRVADIQTDRQDVAEQDRRAKVTNDSMAFLDDLAVYLRLHPETPDIATIAEEIAKLQQALQEGNFTAIDGTTQKLKQRMSDVSGFEDFNRGQIEKRREAEIRALGEAVSLASKHKQFIRIQISEDVTSPNTATFAGLLKQYEVALNQPDLDLLTNLNDRLKQFVSEQGLEARYQAAMAQLKPESPKKPQPVSSAPTNRNRFLMEGDLGDWVLLFNSSGKAPNVVRNIRGEIVFDDATAKACVLHPSRQEIAQADVEDVLAAYQVEHVQFSSDPCPETSLPKYDVLVALRGELLKQSPSYLAPLLGLIEDGKFQELKTLTGAAFQNIKKKNESESTRLENEIATSARSGYGLVKVENGASSICLTTPEDMQDAQRALLDDQGKLLSRLFPSTPEILNRTVEAAFRDAKRGKCGAIYAERADLWEAIQGFRRDNVSYSVVPLWFESQLVSERAEQIRAEQTSQAQMTQDQKRSEEERKLLDKRRRENEAAEASARQKQLRIQHGTEARARADEVFDAIKALVEGEDSWATGAFPELASWYLNDVRDGWEYVSANNEIEDFGTADWKGRPLEVVVADVSIEMKNRSLGEKKVACFRVGLIFDAEFRMRREPFATKCEDEATGRVWKQARGFKSEWVAP